MEQYDQVKQQHPDAMLLFQVGDFYETFGEDAIKASKVLDIVLTSRNNGGSDIELAGFPHHSLEVYMPKLVRAGFRVAICKQLEKPSKEKKIVKRGVTEIVTPGVVQSDSILERGSNNFLASIFFNGADEIGIAFLDISTGEFLVSQGSADRINKLLQGLEPAELLYPKDQKNQVDQLPINDAYSYGMDSWVYQSSYCYDLLKDQFQVASLKGFGIDADVATQIAAGSILHYLQQTENRNVDHIRSIHKIEHDAYVWLDQFTIRNLELTRSMHAQGSSLLDIVDQTITPMGSRLLRRWIVLPLKDITALNQRLDVVEHFYTHPDCHHDISEAFRKINDLERLASKIATQKIHPREIIQLKKSLSIIEVLKKIIVNDGNPALQSLSSSLNPLIDLRSHIDNMLLSEPATLIVKGGVMSNESSEELADLRNTILNAEDLLLALQQTEIQATGIQNLKIGFNNVFGYYLEVTNKYKNQGLVPDHWVRKQTLTGSERYISDDLKKLEDRILSAQDKAMALELRLYDELLQFLLPFIPALQINAQIIAQMDVLQGFGYLARSKNYARPTLTDDFILDIKQGRHPVIEDQLPPGQHYVPNDVRLDRDEQQILMITGPNMSGKSAILRQTALIALLAQIGSYVPADAASIGILDRIFTRVGASDNISSGESTFMVEMNETASIMNNISDRSLILLDEIGRGTSTYDGVSIAWSIAEYLHENGKAQPKTLFATHYHELNELAATYPRIHNYHVATRETGNKVHFLRTLTPGGSEHSFGIHVARMAGMPQSILASAQQVLAQLESQRTQKGEQKIQPVAAQNMQLSMFNVADPQAQKIRTLLESIDINRMTPVECMLKLQELRSLIS